MHKWGRIHPSPPPLTIQKYSISKSSISFYIHSVRTMTTCRWLKMRHQCEQVFSALSFHLPARHPIQRPIGCCAIKTKQPAAIKMQPVKIYSSVNQFRYRWHRPPSDTTPGYYDPRPSVPTRASSTRFALQTLASSILLSSFAIPSTLPISHPFTYCPVGGGC